MDRNSLVCAAILASLAGPASAGFEVCNETALLQSVAIGYKGEADWISEGWWNIEPGDCATLVTGDLTKRYYYYYAEAKGQEFQGQNYMFCTDDEEFTIVGDTDCEKRGYETLGFREVDTGETETEFKLSLADHGALPTPESTPPTADAGTAGGTTQTTTDAPVEVSVSVTADSLTSDLPAGKYGDAFRVDALFQGCEIEGGAEYCGFHASGWKLRAFYSGGTPADLLYALEEMPINTFVALEADMGNTIGAHAEIVVRAVRPKPGSDAHAAMRRAMQGDWTDPNDPSLEFTVRGSELYLRRDGALVSTSFLQIAPDCDTSVGVGPVLIESVPPQQDKVCYVIDTIANGVMDMLDTSTGKDLAFRRLR